MKIHYQCSNCGQKFQTSAMIGVPDGMYISGCRAVVAKRLSDHSDMPYKGYHFRYCEERSE